MDDSTKSYDFDFDVPHYIKETPNRYLDNLTQGMEWLHKKLNLSTEFKQKVILELGSGFGFFLRSIFEDLPSDCIYIAVDYDRTRQLFLKQCLETIPSHKNILFLCADFLKIPIKQGSIDVLCDISGTSNYSFEHTSFLPECMSPYLKSENLLVGSYLLFQKFTTNSMIPKEFQRYFIEADLQKKLHAIDYDILLETHSPIANKGGKYENYFNDGDQVYSYGLIAKRRG
ncbi:MAG: hypothetical protein PWP24_85 [Clostridiales bacterium]|nr:hypothetical protein [Clostridiales bacterium]